MLYIFSKSEKTTCLYLLESHEFIHILAVKIDTSTHFDINVGVTINKITNRNLFKLIGHRNTKQ